jgi:hypothetical protein
MAKKKYPTNQFHVLLDITALDTDDTEREKLVAGIVKMAPQSPLFTSSVVQAEVANLAKTQATYVLARQTAAQSAKQHSADVTAASLAQVANNKSLNLLRTLIENGATSLADVQSMAFVAYAGRPPAPALVPPDSIDVKLGKKGSGRATASAHELGTTRHRYAAQTSPNPITATSWVGLAGDGKSRKLSGPSGSQVWVQLALTRGQLQSAWSVPVLITFP